MDKATAGNRMSCTHCRSNLATSKSSLARRGLAHSMRNRTSRIHRCHDSIDSRMWTRYSNVQTSNNFRKTMRFRYSDVQTSNSFRMTMRGYAQHRGGPISLNAISSGIRGRPLRGRFWQVAGRSLAVAGRGSFLEHGNGYVYVCGRYHVNAWLGMDIYIYTGSEARLRPAHGSRPAFCERERQEQVIGLTRRSLARMQGGALH